MSGLIKKKFFLPSILITINITVFVLIFFSNTMETRVLIKLILTGALIGLTLILIRQNKTIKKLEAKKLDLEISRDSSLEYIDALWKSQKSFIQDEKLSSLNSLVSGVAHELNTPLGISLTAMSYLEEVINSEKGTPIQEDAVPMLYLTLGNLKKSITLVDKFKEIAGSSSFDDIEMVSIEDFITFACCRISTSKTLNSNIKITYNLPEDLHIYISKMSLSIIMKNILENAYDFAYPETMSGIIEISAESNGNDLQINIKDFGAGIPDLDVKHIFDPFFTTKRAHKHYGLGLAISYNLLSRHYNGKITCVSNPGVETTFTLTVPDVVYKNASLVV